jgi:flagellar basal-body rod protein FlgB
MFEKLDITRMAQAMAAHAGARQGLVAANLANADTPGYRAQDLPGFDRVYSGAGDTLRATRPGHVSAKATGPRAEPVAVQGAADPNGNTVSIEAEMVRAADIRQQHDMALSIYRSVGDILRTSLGRGR